MRTTIPVQTLVVLLAIDKVIGQLQLGSVTNMIGNCVAAIVVAYWKHNFDLVKFNQVSSGILSNTKGLS